MPARRSLGQRLQQIIVDLVEGIIQIFRSHKSSLLFQIVPQTAARAVQRRLYGVFPRMENRAAMPLSGRA